MSEAATTERSSTRLTAKGGTAGRRDPVRLAVLAVALVLLLVAPLFLDAFWLRTGFAVFGAVVASFGLRAPFVFYFATLIVAALVVWIALRRSTYVGIGGTVISR